jgi:hypothetical protein
MLAPGGGGGGGPRSILNQVTPGGESHPVHTETGCSSFNKTLLQHQWQIPILDEAV